MDVLEIKRQTESNGCLILLLLSLVPACAKNFPTSWVLTISVNTPPQTSQMVSDFYDVIGRTGSISTLKVLSQTVCNFYNECEHEICLSGKVANDWEFLQ